MVSGKRVFLNDLLEINDAFVELLRWQHIAQSSGDSEFFDGNPENLWNMLTEMSSDELFKRLSDCSKDQNQIISEGYFPIEESIGSLVFRNTFYIEPEKLVLVLGGRDKRVTLHLNDIEDYLKVSKW
jgi:hypothetical protein